MEASDSLPDTPHELNEFTRERISRANIKLWQALRSGLVTEVEQALKDGADPHTPWSTIKGVSSKQRNLYTRLEITEMDQRNPLHYAAYHNLPLAIFELLIKSGAQLDKLNRDQQTPLMIAILRRNADVVSFLLSNGAKLYPENTQKIFPLKIAITQCSLPIVIELLNYILDSEDKALMALAINAIDTQPGPLFATDENTQRERVLKKLNMLKAIFKKYCSDESYSDQDKELKPYEYAFVIRTGITKLATGLFEFDFLSFVSAKGNSLLHKAAASGNKAITLMLLRHLRENSTTSESNNLRYNALSHKRNKKERTPLFSAIAHGRPSLIPLLLTHYARVPSLARVSEYVNKISSLDDATKNEIKELLIRHGAYINVTLQPEMQQAQSILDKFSVMEKTLEKLPINERTYALYCAISTGNLERVKKLLATFITPLNLLAVAYSAMREAENDTSLTLPQKAIYVTILHEVEKHVLRYYHNQKYPGLRLGEVLNIQVKETETMHPYSLPELPQEINRRVLYYTLLDIEPPSFEKPSYVSP